MPPSAQVEASVPRVAIQFCMQCKWNLRAAYYAQELLQTFSTSLGEVALRPATGGVFTVTLETLNEETSALESHLLWDRKRDGGFPETKELKKKVRDIIDPQRDLGHVDGKKSVKDANPATDSTMQTADGRSPLHDSLGVQIVRQQMNADREANAPAACEDCK
ncbi:hypothetical protein ABW21_db0204314 [Orbilia brochopaga]|nr:hypothetical protein ABW21_db0204314 [Drechslerella brochopaga]